MTSRAASITASCARGVLSITTLADGCLASSTARHASRTAAGMPVVARERREVLDVRPPPRLVRLTSSAPLSAIPAARFTPAAPARALPRTYAALGALQLTEARADPLVRRQLAQPVPGIAHELAHGRAHCLHAPAHDLRCRVVCSLPSYRSITGLPSAMVVTLTGRFHTRSSARMTSFA